LLEQRLKLQERLKARKKLTQSEKELSSNIYQRGVDEKGFANIRAKGDTALFGGINTNKMKERLGVKSTRALADFLPTITIKAKDFATEITNFNINKEDMKGEGKISTEHVRNNKEVRATLIRTGIYPEKLPAEEDLQKVERKLNADGKKIGNSKFVQGEVE
jgi:DNA-damage-inducible protein D